MTLQETLENATLVLDAERAMPTISYMAPVLFVDQAAMNSSALAQRGCHPRPVSEDPGYYTLKSRNYDLLRSFCEEHGEDVPLPFLSKICQRLSDPNPFKVVGQDVLGAGRTDRTNSELPLIAEFLVRNGLVCVLLRALPNAPMRPAFTRLLLHIEEMIALDFRLFSNQEYDELRDFVSNTKLKLDELRRQPRISNVLESNYRFHVCNEGPTLCDSIAVQCERAKYLRLAASMTRKPPLQPEIMPAATPVAEDDRPSSGEKLAFNSTDRSVSHSPSQVEPIFSASEDYRSIRYRGMPYALTQRQAVIVGVLHRAHLTGHPVVTKERLLSAVEAETSEVRDSFRDSPIWQTLVCAGNRRGSYRLNLEAETPNSGS